MRRVWNSGVIAIHYYSAATYSRRQSKAVFSGVVEDAVTGPLYLRRSVSLIVIGLL